MGRSDQSTVKAGHYSAFLSYSHTDAALASLIYRGLALTREIPIWFDAQEVRAGDLLRPVIEEAINRVDKIILLCSEASLNSPWVDREIQLWAHRSGDSGVAHPTGTVLPVDLDGYLHLRNHRYASSFLEARVVDARGWAGDADVVERVVRELADGLRVRRQSPFDDLEKRAGRDAD